MYTKIEDLPIDYIGMADGFHYHQLLSGERACIYEVTTPRETFFRICTVIECSDSHKVFYWTRIDFAKAVRKFNEMNNYAS